LLIYDGDCGFCTTSAAWAKRHFRQAVDVQPWQSLDLSRYGLTEQDVITAAYWIDEAGTAHRGHEAAAYGLKAMAPAWRLLGAVLLTPPFSLAARGLYALVARNRHRLPGSTDACRLPSTPDKPR
jgi:predicted DCC family thiol-disulfide oxidoreductase YuxK